MKNFKFIIIAIILASTMVFSVLNTGVEAQFDPLEPGCSEIEAGIERPDFCDEAQNTTDPLTGTEGIIVTVANLLAIVSGIIAVIIMVVAGIQMMTSTGDSGKVKSARDAIIYTAVGIVVILLARTIVIFIITKIG